MENNGLFSKIAGSLYGVRIGDAMGRFAEILKPKEIRERTGGKGIEGFTFLKRDDTPWLKDLGPEELGGVTDDTILTDLIAQSIIELKKFDLWDIALRHVRAFESGANGFGKTTINGLEEIKLYFDSRASAGRLPGVWPEMKENSGCGNGVAMKISACSAFAAAKYHEHCGYTLDTQIAQIGSLTHADKRATAAAYALGIILFHMYMNPDFDGLDIWFAFRKTFFSLLNEFTKKMLLMDSADEMVKFFEPLFDPKILSSANKLRQKTKTTCFALHSIPFAIGVFLRNMNDFRAGILEAVNAGGDTDTNAAMAGALIGARVGIEGIPAEWRNYRQEYKEAEVLAQGLINAAKCS